MNNLSKYYDDKLINGEFTTAICTNNSNVEKALTLNKIYNGVQSKLRKDCYAIKIKEYKTNNNYIMKDFWWDFKKDRFKVVKEKKGE